MEKTIKLIMREDKNIEISLNNQTKQSIPENNRKISAQEVYNLLDFKPEDRFVIITENDTGKDKQVLLFFKELFGDICTKINELKFKEQDDVANSE